MFPFKRHTQAIFLLMLLSSSVQTTVFLGLAYNQTHTKKDLPNLMQGSSWLFLFFLVLILNPFLWSHVVLLSHLQGHVAQKKNNKNSYALL